MLRTADVESHASNVALVYWSDYLCHNRIAYLFGKLHELLLIVAHLLRYHGNACTLEELSHYVWLNETIILDTGDDVANAWHIHSE